MENLFNLINFPFIFKICNSNSNYTKQTRWYEIQMKYYTIQSETFNY